MPKIKTVVTAKKSSEASKYVMPIRFRESDVCVMQQLAADSGLPTSAWIRQIVMRELRRINGKGDKK